jgi:hypothetical protein
MSNSASISAAKKRRGGTPPMTGNGVGGAGLGMNGMNGMNQPQQQGLPPGLPPNFRQLPPHIQQQMFIQLQQRAAAASKMGQQQQQQQQQQPQQQPPHSIPPAPIQTRNPQSVSSGALLGNNTMSVPGPYTVNSVLHNRAVAEVNGVHIRDLPISSAGLPCLPSGAALPPNVLFKLHHDELLNMDAVLNEHSNKIQMCVNRLENVERSHGIVSVPGNNGNNNINNINNNNDSNSSSYDSLVNNTDFITKLLDNILTNTNLSDIINQIEPLQKENESLRALLNSQQVALNELSGLVMKLLSTKLHSDIEHNENNENNNNDTNNHIVLNYDPHDNIGDVDVSMYNPYIEENNNTHTEQYNIENVPINNLEEVGELEGVEGGDESNNIEKNGDNDEDEDNDHNDEKGEDAES